MRRTIIPAIATAVALALALSGCGTSPKSNSAQPTPAPAVSAAPNAVPAPSSTAPPATAPVTKAPPSTSPPTTVTKQTAGEFILETVGYMVKGQYGRQYATLHSAQQALVTEQQFEASYKAAGSLPADTTFKVTETYAESATVPGTNLGMVQATAVTLKATAPSMPPRNLTMHAYMVNGSWRWTLTPDALKEMEAEPSA